MRPRFVRPRIVLFYLGISALCTACTPEPDEPEDPGDLSSDWDYEAELGAGACASPDAVGAAVEAALTTMIALDPGLFFDAYNTLLNDHGEPSCPVLEPIDDAYATGHFWQAGCDTTAGASFDGRVNYYHYDDQPGAGFTIDEGEVVYMTGRMTDPVGNYLEGSGTVARLSVSAVQGNQQMYATEYQFNGVFELVTDQGDFGWLTDDTDPGHAVQWGTVPGLNGRWLQVRGSAGGLDGIGELGGVVSFLGFTMWSLPLNPCNDEPSGAVAVRCDDGEWLEVLFHGPNLLNGETEPVGGACDGIGDVFHRGELIGTTQVNTAPHMAWSELPWPPPQNPE